MNAARTVTKPLNWLGALGFIIGATGCFHLAYAPTDFKPLRLFAIGYVICLAQLARLKSTRQSFYAGLIAAFLCIAPQLLCFWNIFGPGAVVLWLILALWIGAFTGMLHATLARLGTGWTAALTPFIWMGLEYFRSELYYLKFSWLNVGYAFSGTLVPYHVLGMYGAGFVVAICAAAFVALRGIYAALVTAAIITTSFATGILIFLGSIFVPALSQAHRVRPVNIAGIQMEFPAESEIPAALDKLLAAHTNADILVLSEYTLDGPVPESLKNWCRINQRFLVVGGKDPAPNNNFYDSAFVVGTNGEIVFRQVKSVPIQFFKDGLPAPEQKIWESPWGKIGFCVCYDLSYTRVVDGLIKQGAQLIIVPTMDVADWGVRQHQLHALVAPVRAAEYGVPIFRLASSGISQAVGASGNVVATAPFAGEGKDLFMTISFPNTEGSLPLDRIIAPFSVGVTGVLLLILIWKARSERGSSKVANGTAEQSNAEPSSKAEFSDKN
jgi:apolipoprotein N-acyltransferase